MQDNELARRLGGYADAVVALSFVSISAFGLAVADPDIRCSLAGANMLVAIANLLVAVLDRMWQLFPFLQGRVRLMEGLGVAFGTGRDVVDNNALPEGSAGGDKPCVMLAFGLIELMIFQRFEVKRGGKIKRMIGDRASLGLRRSTDETAFEIGNLREAMNFYSEEVSLSRSQILA